MGSKAENPRATRCQRLYRILVSLFLARHVRCPDPTKRHRCWSRTSTIQRCLSCSPFGLANTILYNGSRSDGQAIRVCCCTPWPGRDAIAFTVFVLLSPVLGIIIACNFMTALHAHRTTLPGPGPHQTLTPRTCSPHHRPRARSRLRPAALMACGSPMSLPQLT